MIKIISSHSNFGGSTLIFINLSNLFNDKGLECEFYGPHPWHLNKCRGKLVSDLILEADDIVIGHYRSCPEGPFRKAVFSPHEKNLYILKPSELAGYDTIVFSSQSQMDWHFYYKGSQRQVLIPALAPKLQPVVPTPGVAGVIGTISLQKQTHVSIFRALQDGMEKVLLYGDAEPNYLEQVVSPLLGDRVEWKGLAENRQEMYASISCVYHSSTFETASSVMKECQCVGIPFYGNDNIPDYETWDDDRVFDAWCQVLDL